MYNGFIESFYSNWPRQTIKIRYYKELLITPEFYRVLGITLDANQDTIKKAYKKKVIETHPDKGGKEEEFKKVQEAYETLSDPKSREYYNIVNCKQYGIY